MFSDVFRLLRGWAARAVLATALLLASAFTQAQPSHNFLFIAIDDLRNWLGYTGEYPGVVTPSIDALAATSTRYRNAYTTGPICTSARTSIMFGLSPAALGITGFVLPSWPQYVAVFDNPNLQSIPEVLSGNGYHTAAAGKVFHIQHTERWDDTGPPIDIASIIDWSPGPDNTYINPVVLPDTETHPDQAVADWGIEFINNYASSVPGIAGEPFFMALGFYQPHLPWRVHQAWYDLYPLEEVVAPAPIPGDLDDVPAQGVALANAPLLPGGLPTYTAIEASGRAREYTRAYLASISHTDAMVGQVLAALANSPHASNTTVILWSDHGYHLGEKFHWHKVTFWQESARVPLLISSPSPDYPVGDVTAEVSLLDLAATVIDLAGLPPFTQFQGAPLHDAAQPRGNLLRQRRGNSRQRDQDNRLRQELAGHGGHGALQPAHRSARGDQSAAGAGLLIRGRRAQPGCPVAHPDNAASS